MFCFYHHHYLERNKKGNKTQKGNVSLLMPSLNVEQTFCRLCSHACYKLLFLEHQIPNKDKHINQIKERNVELIFSIETTTTTNKSQHIDMK